MQIPTKAVLRDKNDGNEYELYVSNREEKVSLNNISAIKNEISSLRREIMDTRSEIKSAIYFTAMAQLYMIAFCFLCLVIVLISQ